MISATGASTSTFSFVRCTKQHHLSSVQVRIFLVQLRSTALSLQVLPCAFLFLLAYRGGERGHLSASAVKLIVIAAVFRTRTFKSKNLIVSWQTRVRAVVPGRQETVPRDVQHFLFIRSENCNRALPSQLNLKTIPGMRKVGWTSLAVVG